MGDWVKHFGKPNRIILDQGAPGLDGREWGRRVKCSGGNTFERQCGIPTKMGWPSGLFGH